MTEHTRTWAVSGFQHWRCSTFCVCCLLTTYLVSPSPTLWSLIEMRILFFFFFRVTESNSKHLNYIKQNVSFNPRNFKSHSWVLTPRWKVLVLYWYPIPQGKPCVHSRLYSYFPGIKSLWFFLGGTQWSESTGSSHVLVCIYSWLIKRCWPFKWAGFRQRLCDWPVRTGMTTSQGTEQENGSCLGCCLLSSLAHGNSGWEDWADEGLCVRRKQGECLQWPEGKLRVLQGPLLQLYAVKASLWAISVQPYGTSLSLTGNWYYSVSLLVSHPGGCKQCNPVWVVVKTETKQNKKNKKQPLSPTHTHEHTHTGTPPFNSVLGCFMYWVELWDW